MKKHFFLLFTVFTISSLHGLAQDNFSITGKIAGLKDGTKVTFTFFSGGSERYSVVKDGKFTLSGRINEPESVSVFVDPNWELNENGTLKTLNYQRFFLDRGETNITGENFPNARIIGGSTQAEYIKSNIETLRLKQDSVFLPWAEAVQHRKWDTILISKVYPKYIANRDSLDAATFSYIKEHKDSYITLKLVMSLHRFVFRSLQDSLFNTLSSRIKNTDQGKKFALELLKARELSVGNAAPDFSQQDVNGKLVSLSSYKGKYVLIEFWASWCKPCRVESPYLIKAYDNFKDKNFDILSVSQDVNKEMWIKAIKDDKTGRWAHVSDLKGTGNQVSKAWGINGIPRNFLLDPNGVIVAMDLRSEGLELKLNEVLKH